MEEVAELRLDMKMSILEKDNPGSLQGKDSTSTTSLRTSVSGLVLGLR